MSKNRINPSVGGYFKHEGRIYQAKKATELGKCYECCFHKLFGNHYECWAPPVNCAGKIFEDVTDTVDVELVDDKKYNPLAVLSVLLTGTVIFWFMIYKLIIKFLI